MLHLRYWITSEAIKRQSQNDINRSKASLFGLPIATLIWLGQTPQPISWHFRLRQKSASRVWVNLWDRYGAIQP